ncbi:unnamed protein product [Caenorhabditis nigoni]
MKAKTRAEPGIGDSEMVALSSRCPSHPPTVRDKHCIRRGRRVGIQSSNLHSFRILFCQMFSIFPQT